MSTNIVKLNLTERYSGPAVLKEGLRPFFLLANVWAILAIVLWVALLTGGVSGPTGMTALDWHRHELVFGYTSAVIGGFLLTVVANWTGRAPVSGAALASLVLLWIAGRVAMWLAGTLPPVVVASIELAFPLSLVFVCARELVLGRNYKNLRVIGVLGAFIVANGIFHIAWMRGLSAEIGSRLGLSTVLILIMVIGGRIIPAFTRNWLIKRDASRLPRSFELYDGITIVFSAIVLLAWSLGAESMMLGWAMLFATLLHTARLASWCGEKTLAEPLLLIMHLGYALIPVGFFAMAAMRLWNTTITSSAAIHLWSTGAVAVMCMAVMTRASLGHTGQELRVSPLILASYVLLLSSVLLRFVANVSPHYMLLINASAVLWCMAHLAFLIRYTRILTTTSR